MEYKTEFGTGDVTTIGNLEYGELFRFSAEASAYIRCPGYASVCLNNGIDNEALTLEHHVVRIRIARVEDGVPVFVDA